MQEINKYLNNLDNISLKHSFQDACSNKEFKEYVFNLGVKEDILIKYTSKLA